MIQMIPVFTPIVRRGLLMFLCCFKVVLGVAGQFLHVLKIVVFRSGQDLSNSERGNSLPGSLLRWMGQVRDLYALCQASETGVLELLSFVAL